MRNPAFIQRVCRYLCPLICAICVALALLPGTRENLTPGQRLVSAAGAGNTRSVECLLKNGGDVNATVPVLNSALSFAAYNGHSETVALLLSRGAKVDPVNEAGNTPLWLAAAAGHADVVRQLLAARAEVNHRGSGGVTPLIVAVCSGDLETLQVLIAAGADIDAKDDKGITALAEARIDQNRAAVELLSKMERRCADAPAAHPVDFRSSS